MVFLTLASVNKFAKFVLKEKEATNIFIFYYFLFIFPNKERHILHIRFTFNSKGP
jgi:hypothetical protein